MNRMATSLAVFALASTLGFAQGQQQAPVVANPDPQIEQLKGMIKHLQGTVQSNRNAQTETGNELKALRKELAARERMQQEAERERQRVDALREKSDAERNVREQRKTLFVDGISGGLLILVAIGGCIGFRFRVRKHRNQKMETSSKIVSFSVESAETPADNDRLTFFPELPDDPSPLQIKNYAKAQEKAFGKVEFWINVRPSDGNPSFEGRLAHGEVTKNNKGDLQIGFIGVDPKGIDRRRTGARNYFLLNIPVSTDQEGQPFIQ